MTLELPVALTMMGLVVLASTFERLTGIGFAMMLAPFLVVMLGPHGGVMLTALLAVIGPSMMIPQVRREIEWPKLAIIAPAALVVMPFFGWLAATTPQGPLYIMVAVLVV